MDIEIQNSNLSPEARIVWDRLGESQRQVIQKNYPFRDDRNEAIRKLRARKVKLSILSQITGLCIHTVCDIGKKTRQKGGDKQVVQNLAKEGLS